MWWRCGGKEGAMFSLRYLLDWLDTPYIWADVLLIKETPKAILILFDGQKAWFPKVWITRIKKNKVNTSITIKTALYRWTKNFHNAHHYITLYVPSSYNNFVKKIKKLAYFS